MDFQQPIPEIPVSDVPAAQRYYRDKLGFQIGFYDEPSEFGEVRDGESVLYLRRKELHPLTLWIMAPQVDAVQDALAARGAHIVSGVEDKDWGLRQFTVHDPDGNILVFFCPITDA
jgi:catechol 2,3-dioxygenase-like lactoylglutathione lyase family enzyme